MGVDLLVDTGIVDQYVDVSHLAECLCSGLPDAVIVGDIAGAYPHALGGSGKLLYRLFAFRDIPSPENDRRAPPRKLTGNLQADSPVSAGDHGAPPIGIRLLPPSWRQTDTRRCSWTPSRLDRIMVNMVSRLRIGSAARTGDSFDLTHLLGSSGGG